MEKTKGHSDVDSSKWIEEDLFKLPCKELKKLARQSNVNPNFKKVSGFFKMNRYPTKASSIG